MPEPGLRFLSAKRRKSEKSRWRRSSQTASWSAWPMNRSRLTSRKARLEMGKRPVLAFCLAMFITIVWCLPAAAAEAKTSESPVPTGKVSLEFQGVNILDVLKLLSKRSGLNIVAGKNVQGQVSLFVQNVEVMDALATILETSDLAYIKDRGIIKVMTKKDYEDLYGKPYQDTRVSRQYALRYARAQALAETLVQMKSAFGQILVEPRTNTLIVTETPAIVKEMESLIRKTDQPSV